MLVKFNIRFFFKKKKIGFFVVSVVETLSCQIAIVHIYSNNVVMDMK